jgi:hypothetical protein
LCKINPSTTCKTEKRRGKTEQTKKEALTIEQVKHHFGWFIHNPLLHYSNLVVIMHVSGSMRESVVV